MYKLYISHQLQVVQSIDWKGIHTIRRFCVLAYVYQHVTHVKVNVKRVYLIVYCICRCSACCYSRLVVVNGLGLLSCMACVPRFVAFTAYRLHYPESYRRYDLLFGSGWVSRY